MGLRPDVRNVSLSDSRRMDSMEESLRPPYQAREHYGENALGSWRQVILVFILDASIVSTSLVTISLDFGDFINVPWVVISYLLAYLAFAVTFAKLSDMYGRKNLVIAAWVLFSGSSVGCGLARSMTTLIIFRAVQGIGGSGLYSLAQVGLFEVGPKHKPSLLGALIGMTLAVSFVLGPVLGGLISRFTTWRWIFFINIPCGIVALVGLIFSWPHTPRSRLGPWDTLKRIDTPGIVLIIAASSLLVFALQEAGSFNYAWSSITIILTLSIAATCWISLIGWEVFLGLRGYKHVQPILPLRLITRRPYLAALICTLFTGFNYLAIIIVLPERFQIVNGDDSLMAGVHLLPLLGACAFGSFLAGAISSKKNNTAPTLIAASCLQLLGVGLLSTLSDITSAVQAQYGYQAIYGLGVGLSLASATILASLYSHPNDNAVAQGALAQARVFGGAIGIAVCMIIFNNRVNSALDDTVDLSDMPALYNSHTITGYLPPDQALAIAKIYASAFTDDVKIMIGLSVVGLAASILTFERHPPPMPSQPRNKEPLVIADAAQRETELDEMTSNH